MNSEMQDYVMNYSYTKLEETARTFRSLGEAYQCAPDKEKDHKGFSRQLFLVADVLEECMSLNIHTHEADKETWKNMSRKALRYGIKIGAVNYIQKNQLKRELSVVAKVAGRGCVSIRKLNLVVDSVLGAHFFSEASNSPVVNEQFRQFVFCSEDRFRILTGVSKVNKKKEKVSGDNFLVSRLQSGKTVAAIADGCGSGRRACMESQMVIELMENCLEAGFDEKTALDLINSAYASEDNSNNPVTVDMSVIDCCSGMLQSIKLGAASTFIKREAGVDIIKSAALPIGVLDYVDYRCVSRKLYDGDYCIMLSDGVLDCLPGVDKEMKMVDIINNLDLREPKSMADDILKKALKCNKMVSIDDCTVLVIGVFDTYNKG